MQIPLISSCYVWVVENTSCSGPHKQFFFYRFGTPSSTDPLTALQSFLDHCQSVGFCIQFDLCFWGTLRCVVITARWLLRMHVGHSFITEVNTGKLRQSSLLCVLLLSCLYVSLHPEGPETVNLDTGFPSSKCSDGS